MKNIFLLLIFIFPNSNQLSCFLKCLTIPLNYLNSFHEPSDVHNCSNDTQALKCYGQLLTYYQGNDHLKHISYSLGPRKHIIETEIEELVNKDNFKSVIYFLFVIDSFHTNEVVIRTHIICRTTNNCALKYIRDLFHSYVKQRNPSSQLKHLLYNTREGSTLVCYNSETKHIEECSLSQRSTCIINNTDILQQKCYAEWNTRLEYGFMITSSVRNSIKKTLELIVCNVTGCNDEFVSKQVETIIYNYTLSGIKMTFNNSNRLKLNLFIYISTYFFSDYI